ncbi:hypothetical protein HPB48_011542 [Haemaphysalis longicornis]|uniref:EB domain-containing protein n=1 Tax=Haemaphysalis longicornis TaxID=44386 RepID=A0A9J6FPW3_HAELO|nr:hypothetical protein HPB48_011542 [Haemaphysalis longicornis]
MTGRRCTVIAPSLLDLVAAAVTLAAQAAGASPLEEALKGTVPLYQLDSHQGAMASRHPTSFTCMALTLAPTSMRWKVDNSSAPDLDTFDVYYSPLSTVIVNSLTVAARYSTLTIKKHVPVREVRCLVKVYERPANLTPTHVVALKTVAPLLNVRQAPLHVTYGQQCRPLRHGCVPENAACSTEMGAVPLCLCNKGYRYVNHTGLCMSLRPHTSACVLDHPCALVADECREGRCHCRPAFHENSTGCHLNVSLHNGCDDHRFCPDGAHCVHNVCICLPGFEPWGNGCYRRFLSGEGMRKLQATIRIALNVSFTIAMLVLAVWLYHHSHSPSLMRERSVATWEYMPKMDQN